MMSTLSGTITLFVNNQPVLLPEGATIHEAIRRFDRRFLKALLEDKAEVMDEEGWPVHLDQISEQEQRVFVCLLPWAELPRTR